MIALPNALSATISERKVQGYLLAPDQPKSAFFCAVGFRLEVWQTLKSALAQHAAIRDVAQMATSDFGTKYVLSCSLSTPDGRNPCVVTVWITRPENPVPDFVTAYPAR